MEHVWGIPRDILFDRIPLFHGFVPSSSALADLGRDFDVVGEFRPRPEAEEDPSFKQVIPYVMATCNGDVLLLERLRTQGEARLHDLFSIGVGGHVNPEPDGPGSLLERGLVREVREELAVEDVPEPRLLGFINDDSNPVGSVHFGVGLAVEFPEPVPIRETDKMRGHWWPLDRVQEHRERMESWSQFLWDHVVLEGFVR